MKDNLLLCKIKMKNQIDNDPLHLKTCSNLTVRICQKLTTAGSLKPCIQLLWGVSFSFIAKDTGDLVDGGGTIMLAAGAAEFEEPEEGVLC